MMTSSVDMVMGFVRCSQCCLNKGKEGGGSGLGTGHDIEFRVLWRRGGGV